MRVADTSFLYALFSETDEFHHRAVEAVKQPRTILIPPEIFSETMALIQYRQGFRAAVRAGNWLRGESIFEVRPGGESPSEESWRIFRSSKGRLSYPDSVVLAWCKALKADPLAFDEAVAEGV
ncbi:MAG: type II toxin-antitoxin system VapC family toxin [Thermoplasmata archaeon]